MAINSLEFLPIVQTELDKQIVAEATSGWMESNAGQVMYNGGNSVKVPTLDMDGLGDYDRDGGFNGGSVSLTYETLTLGQDRARSFMLDSMDVNETNFVANAVSTMSEFQRRKVIPEIDAYRYSKLYAIANAASRTNSGNTYTTKTVLAALLADIAEINDVAGDVELVCTIPWTVYNLLCSNDDFIKMTNVADFERGEVKTSIRKLNNTIFVPVPSARMKSEYIFYKGVADVTANPSAEPPVVADKKAGGFEPVSGAKNINWIICPSTLPIALSKTDKMRMFDPNTNQTADAWKIDYRKYHELWVKKNQTPALIVNTN